MTGTSAVAPTITPNPVPEVILTNGAEWAYVIELTNRSSTPTTLTKFTIDGNDETSSIVPLFGTTSIPANGFIIALLEQTGLNPPVNRVFAFSGMDPGGATWSQQITVPFTARVLDSPALSLTTPVMVPAASSASASCQWPQPLVLEELGGYDTRLTSLTVNGASYTSQLQQILGTTTIAPFGRLDGTMCWPTSTATGTVNLSLAGATTETGSGVITTASTTLAPAAAALPTPSVSPATVNFSSSSSASVNLSFSGGSPAWTARVSPANRTASWLKVSPASGTGAGQLTLKATSTGSRTAFTPRRC